MPTWAQWLKEFGNQLIGAGGTFGSVAECAAEAANSLEVLLARKKVDEAVKKYGVPSRQVDEAVDELARAQAAALKRCEHK